jgi:DNA-binding MarR family transcriptional regulator
MKLAGTLVPVSECAARGGDVDAAKYALIEALFFAYRDFVEDADKILARDGFGRAHHRVLYFAARNPGLTVAELLDILRITKQSLNRVLKDLLDRGYVISRLGEADRRHRRLAATPRGEALIRRIADVQSARFSRAFDELGPGSEARAAAFLAAMANQRPEHLKDAMALSGRGMAPARQEASVYPTPLGRPGQPRREQSS